MNFKLDGQTTQMMADAMRLEADIMREAAKQGALDDAAQLNERAHTFDQLADAIAGKEVQLTVIEAACAEVQS